MKRFVALTLALMLALAMTVTAFAEETPSPGAKEYYKITVSSEGSGSAEASDVKVEKDSDGTVTLSAPADKGYFTRWIISGDYEILDGKTIYDPVITIRPISDIEAIASFSVDKDYLTMTVETVTDGNGTASVDKNKVLKGSDEEVTFTATEDGDEFVEWQLFCDYKIVSGSLTSKTLTVIPYTDIRAVAYFKISSGPNPDDNPDSPKTGDPLPYVICFMAIALGAAVLASKKLKKAE